MIGYSQSAIVTCYTSPAVILEWDEYQRMTARLSIKLAC